LAGHAADGSANLGFAMLDVSDAVRVHDDGARFAAGIDYLPSSAVRDALAALGRTEDIRFSPDNSLAALAGYGRNTCLVLTMRIEGSNGGASIALEDFVEIHSPAIVDPHGFDFIGNDRLVIANRSGAITVFRLPQQPFNGRTVTLKSERSISRIGLFHRLRTPGSVAVVLRTGGDIDVYVCNTFGRRVSSHRIKRGGVPFYTTGRVVAESGLDVPDGIAISPDKHFMAVSNHNNQCVSIFDLTAPVGPAARIAGTLNGISYPHGLRFSPDGKALYVADAGAPLVHKFDAPDGNWAIDATPSNSVPVLSEQVFLAGRHNEQEGGPKGLDLDSSGTIMAITCEEQPLAFFSVERLFG
jgi:hypothetical protein